MSGITLTKEVWAVLQENNPKIARAMKNDPEFKGIILQFTKEATQHPELAEAYENDGLFTVAGKSYEFYEVVEIALNSLTYRQQNAEYEAHKALYPAIYARKTEAWTILNELKEHYADVETFSTKTEFLRGLVEARLQ
jgi:hypothetical protein